MESLVLLIFYFRILQTSVSTLTFNQMYTDSFPAPPTLIPICDTSIYFTFYFTAMLYINMFLAVVLM